mgnify:CR=1 FL=1
MKISAIKNNNKTLSEALGQPYPYEWTEKTARGYVAEYGKLVIAFIPSSEFGYWTITFDVDDRVDTTGKGDAFKILSTVVAATKEWWAEQDPTQISAIKFSGEKDTGDGGGRIALYRRFANQFAKDIGFVARDGTDRTAPSTTNYVLTNPNFQPKVNEDGKIVKGVNTTADVQPGETQRQAAKFGNKLNSKGEPPLLNAKARKNSSPHVLGNLGLAEAASPTGNLEQLRTKLTNQYNLKDLRLGDMSTRSAFEISSIIVNKDDQKSGTGTAVMQELIAYADKNDKIVVLDPALKDKHHGTTSQSRLRKFYKRFGFIDNKGRNKNYEFRNIMIRYPQSNKVTESAQDVSAFGVDATTSETDDMIVLDQVKARDRATGAGTKYMQELAQYADSVGKPITLTPSNSLGGSVARLKKFYKRFGFIEHNGGKNYEMIRYPQTKKVTEDMQDEMYGYKAMNYNPETGEITSGADSRVTKGIKLRKGMTLKMPGKGIFMSTNRKYIEDYYSGHNDHEVLIKFKFDPATITSGNLTDRENEFTVPSATVVGFKVTDNLNESRQLNELFDKQYNWHWKIEPDAMDATSRADFRTHDGQLVAVGFDLQNGNASVDFAKNFAFDATNEGDQFRIFATVMDVIRDYAEKIDLKTLTFSAEKNPNTNSSSRIKLYKRMVSKFAQQINMNFEFHDGTVATIFKLTNNKMNEAIKKPRPEDTLGVSRADMPQIHASHYPELFNYLKQHGASISKGSVAATELKAVQGEFSDAGVEKMMRKGGVTADGTKKPLIVSADNYIIDGHHRWLAAYNLEEEVPIIKFGLPVKELLQLVKDFKHTTYRGIYKENISVTGTERHEQEREKNLEPGTKAWFAHWFSLPKMTREDLNYFKEEVVKFVNDKKGVQDEKTINNRGHNRH